MRINSISDLEFLASNDTERQSVTVQWFEGTAWMEGERGETELPQKLCLTYWY
jgi:hypothetical protein